MEILIYKAKKDLKLAKMNDMFLEKISLEYYSTLFFNRNLVFKSQVCDSRRVCFKMKISRFKYIFYILKGSDSSCYGKEGSI